MAASPADLLEQLVEERAEAGVVDARVGEVGREQRGRRPPLQHRGRDLARRGPPRHLDDDVDGTGEQGPHLVGEPDPVLLPHPHLDERPVVDAGGGQALELSEGASELDERAFLKVRVREKLRVGLADEVRALFPGAVDVVVETGAGGGPGTTADGDETRLEGRSPAELFGAYLAQAGVEDPRLGALFDELLEEVGG